MQKYKFEIWRFKSTILDPEKEEENPPKHFLGGFGFDSALKTIDAQMFFWSVFSKITKNTKSLHPNAQLHTYVAEWIRFLLLFTPNPCIVRVMVFHSWAHTVICDRVIKKMSTFVTYLLIDGVSGGWVICCLAFTSCKIFLEWNSLQVFCCKWVRKGLIERRIDWSCDLVCMSLLTAYISCR